VDGEVDGVEICRKLCRLVGVSAWGRDETENSRVLEEKNSRRSWFVEGLKIRKNGMKV
jgi:hypothetical protein